MHQPFIVPAVLRHARRGFAKENWAPMPKPRLKIAHLVGHIPLRGTEQLAGLLHLQKECGDVVRLELPVGTAHLVTDLDAIQKILIDEQRIFGKQTRGYDILRQFLGNGLVTSEGDFWRRQRRIAQPAFHKERLDEFVSTMCASTQNIIDEWANRAEVDAAVSMNRLALQIAGLTLLSTDPTSDASQISKALEVVLHAAIGRIENPFQAPQWIKTKRNRSFDDAAKTLDRVVYRIIAERRSGEEKNDLLQMFLEAKDEDTGEKMSDAQLRDEVMTMFLAGHETTANAMAWTLYLLAKHPEWQDKIAEEAKGLDSNNLTPKDITRLQLTKQVVQESMRLFPPVWVTGRAPTVDTTLGGFDVPKGSLIFIPMWVLHRHPQHWPSPDQFKPERFAPDKVKQMKKMQYIPFIAGPRMCIGAQFAMMESVLITALLVNRYRFSSLNDPVPEPLLTLRPKGGVQLSLRPR